MKFLLGKVSGSRDFNLFAFIDGGSVPAGTEIQTGISGHTMHTFFN